LLAAIRAWAFPLSVNGTFCQPLILGVVVPAASLFKAVSPCLTNKIVGVPTLVFSAGPSPFARPATSAGGTSIA